MKKLLCLIAPIFLILSTSVCAQITGMNMSMFQAQGEFNRNIDSDPIGVSFTHMAPIKEGPWSVGGELGIAMYSSKEYTTVDDNGNEIDVFEEDCFYSLHAQTQYNLIDDKMVVVYGEGRVGFTTFFSEMHALDEDAAFDDSFKFHGTAFNLGIGAGARVNLSRMIYGETSASNSVWLDGAVSSNSGSRATYRNAGENTYSLSDANFHSLTDYIHFRIGLAMTFDCQNSQMFE